MTIFQCFEEKMKILCTLYRKRRLYVPCPLKILRNILIRIVFNTLLIRNKKKEIGKKRNPLCGNLPEL
jgi:hypothetical protein